MVLMNKCVTLIYFDIIIMNHLKVKCFWWDCPTRWKYNNTHKINAFFFAHHPFVAKRSESFYVK